MASIYARGDVIWIKFKNKHGDPECRSSGYRRGQETLARELAAEVERWRRQPPQHLARRSRPVPCPRSFDVVMCAPSVCPQRRSRSNRSARSLSRPRLHRQAPKPRSTSGSAQHG